MISRKRIKILFNGEIVVDFSVEIVDNNIL